jgi:hypothetical protein
VKIDASPSDNSESRKRAETFASPSSPVTILFESTSSNDVKAIVKSSLHKSGWSNIFGSNVSKVNPAQLDSAEKDSKKNLYAFHPCSAYGIPTYIPLISFMPQPPRAHTNASLKQKNEQNSTPNASVNTNPQPGQMDPGEQTANRLDPNELLEQNISQTIPKIDDQNSMSNNATPQVHIRPSNDQSDKRVSSPKDPASWTASNTSTPNPIIDRLRLHARSNLGCIKYMSFSALVAYSNDCFKNMRMYSENKDYANAYTHGLQGMM